MEIYQSYILDLKASKTVLLQLHIKLLKGKGTVVFWLTNS